MMSVAPHTSFPVIDSYSKSGTRIKLWGHAANICLTAYAALLFATFLLGVLISIRDGDSFDVSAARHLIHDSTLLAHGKHILGAAVSPIQTPDDYNARGEHT